MRQIVIPRPGPPEVLEIREQPDPVPGPGQVHIRVRYAGVNFADLAARQGLYPDAPPFPCVVGYEVSGEIGAVGAGVTRFRPGDRVFAMPHFGGYSDQVVVAEEQAYALPAAMSFEEAAALPVVYLTAYHMLWYVGRLRPRDRVLIHSAAGGVGLAAIQLARGDGRVLIGTASPAKHTWLGEQGLDHAIDSSLRGAELVRAVRGIVGERGVDVVLDPVGGRSWTDGYGLLAPAGRLVCFGFSAATPSETRSYLTLARELLGMKWWNPLKLMGDNKTISGVNLERFFRILEVPQAEFPEILALYEKGVVKPHVDRTFPFDQAAEAHRYIHARKTKGKVLLSP